MTEHEPSHYQRLGVTPAASTEEIRKAYRSLVARLHPDRLHGAPAADREFAERRMREVNEAWRILQDPTRRRAYDAERRALGRSRTAGAGGGRDASVVAADDEPRGADVDAVGGDGDGDDDLVDVLPPLTGLGAGLLRHLPWVIALLLLGGIFILSAYADRGGGGDDRPPARQATVGDCLDLAGGTATTIVSCSGPYEFRVVARVARVEECPAGTEARRLGADNLFECLSAS